MKLTKPTWPGEWRLAFAALALSLVSAVCAGSCSGEPSQAAQEQPGRQAAFSLNVMDESIWDSGKISMSVQENAAWAEVVVTADVSGLKAAYFELEYDPQRFYLAGQETGGMLVREGQGLSLTVEPEPGRILHGQVLPNWPELDGASGSGMIASFRFVPGSSQRTPAKAVSSVPDKDQAAHALAFDPETLEFQWLYTNPGDYDQNGEVGISDLTPLGANFNALGPFDNNSAKFLIDGDGNGQIGISDITTIGANFGNNIESYAVFGSTNQADYPATNTSSNGPGARQIKAVLFSAAQGGVTARKHWAVTAGTPIVGGKYWLRPIAGGVKGTPSALVSHDQSWHFTELLSVNPLDNYVNWVSYANVAGKPAVVISYIDLLSTNPTFLYQSAHDSLGKTWNSPAPAYTVFTTHINPVLAEVDGVPAIAWNDNGTGALKFGKATDASGLYWKPSKTIASVFTSSHKLIEYNGKPLVGYSQGGGLKVTVSIDSEGGTWLPPVTLYPSPAQSWTSMDLVQMPGGVGIVTNDSIDDALVYCYAAIDGTTVTPATPVTILPGGTGVNTRVEIGFAGGVPFVMSMRGGYLLYYSYGLDPLGEDWTGLALAGLDGSCYRFSTTGAYGVPWVCYVDEAANTFFSGYGTDLGGGPWDNALQIVYYPSGIASGLNSFEMGQAGPHPCVAFNQWKDDRVFFAAFY